VDTWSPATPIGLVSKGKENPSERLPNDKVMRAVVCYPYDAGKSVVITSAVEFSERESEGDCIQTGPFLVRDGRDEADLNALDVELKFNFAHGAIARAFLLLDSQDSIVVGVTMPVSFPVTRCIASLDTGERLWGERSGSSFGTGICRTSCFLCGGLVAQN
jgi:hypothetical protein